VTVKKISQGYYIVFALLMIGAAVDFYHYAAIGTGLIRHYTGVYAVRQLVQNTLFQGIIKAFAGVLVIAAGMLRVKAKRTSLAAVTCLLALVVFAVWGASMYCLTSVAAEYAASRYLANYSDFAATITNRNLEYDQGYDCKYENYGANRMWEAVDEGGRAGSFSSFTPAIDGDAGFIERPDYDMVYSAAAIFDSSGKLLECSWEDFFYFEYMTEEQWLSREERSHNNARAFFDREKLTEAGAEMVSNSGLTFDAAALRFTGSFDSVEFTPQKIEYIDWDEFQNALHSKGSGEYTVSGVVEDYDLPWTSLYDDPDAVPHSGETVTFYSGWFDVCCHPLSPCFAFRGKEYDSAAVLVAELGPELAAGRQNMVRYEGGDMILPSVNYCFSVNGERHFSPYFYGEDAFTDAEAALHFYTVSVVYCSPWYTAFGELRSVYLCTLLLAAALVLAVRSVIKRHLLQPVQAVGEAMTGGEGKPYPEVSKVWYESRLLQEGFAKYSDTLRMQKNEITRLNTALEYAKTAEENRRQMTSNIAHELKTPLAVIHSYAEGLKEHIAEDKRDKYIDVILSEAERTDAMVLEMLDISRLEAGKVKLSRDDFSLISLTRLIFEKLEMAAQAKNLRIAFSFPEDFTITADEGRISQVVENFAANAIKYTPVGGHILVKIQTGRSGTAFRIENDSEPLSSEALSKVWDTFYRTDEARSGGGTGLGLAIAKNIVELHGGKCSVRNTKTGVEFGFVI